MPADPIESPVPLAEISQGPNAFEAFLDRNQKNLIALAILLALATAALVVYRGIETGRQTSAGEALNKAEDLAALQAVISEHAGTKAAQSAVVLLAENQWADKKQDAAIETLRGFITANPDHPAHAAAQASLGAKLMAQGKSGEAVDVFQSIVSDPKARYIAPYALISLGDLAKTAGDLTKAEASYNRVKSEFSESAFVETATRRISALKAKAPVEIAPPPVPVAPPAAPGAQPAVVTPPAAVQPAEQVPPAVAPSQETTPEPTQETSSGPTPSNP
jgi:predicted negative regulator of RcsB-dependent stress response